MVIRVLLIEDDAVVRQGLRFVLESEPDIRVVGAVGDVKQVGPMLAALRPDVLVLDPGVAGLEAVQRLSREAAPVRVLVHSIHAEVGYAAEALRMGATGCIPKGAPSAELIRAVRSTAGGRRYVGPRHARAPRDTARDAATSRYEGLSPREREVLHMVVEGHTSSGIAALLGISTRTVETHRSNLMRKLGTRTSAGLVRFALEVGIIPSE